MKDIIIGGAGWEEKLDKAIKEAEGRATARTIKPGAIVDVLKYVEVRLGVSKKALEGTTVVADYNAQTFPAAYKGVPESTIFSAIFLRGTWRVTDISRGKTHSPHHACQVQMTDECKAAVIEKLSKFGL